MNKQDILEAAAGIFREKGFHATSMKDIAEAVHLQKASLYHHIDSKQEILLALLDQALDLLIDDMQSIVESDHPPPEKLKAAIHRYMNMLAANADLATVLLLEYRSLAPEFHRRHVKRRDRFESLWRQILKEGVDSGDFRELDPAVTGFALLGALNWMITWYQAEGDLTAGELAERFHAIFHHGLALDGG